MVLLLGAAACRNGIAAEPWQALPQYQFGQSREPLAAIEEQIRKSSPAEREAIERRLLDLLGTPTTTQDSRRFICRWLGRVGTEKSVAPLAALLSNPDLAHPARIGLEALPCPSAAQALTDALGQVQGKQLLGVIASVGTRRVAGAVPALAKLLNQTDSAVIAAAMAALGEIGTEAASQALSSATVNPALARNHARARIAVATRLMDAGKKPEAATVFRDLMRRPDQPAAIRVATFQGLAASLPREEAVQILANAFEGDDALMRSAAVKAFANAGEARVGIAARLPSMQPRGQLLLLGILKDAPDLAVRTPLVQLVGTASDPAVKAAALECLAVHGEADDVPLVAKWAASGEEPMRAAARQTLQRMSRTDVDAAMIRLIETAESGQRRAILEALPGRRMESALPALQRQLRGADPQVASEAAKAIGLMGNNAQVRDLAQAMTATPNADLRRAAQEAVRVLCTRAEDKTACAEAVRGEVDRATTPEARAVLLPLAVYVGGTAGLTQVLKGMEDANAEVRAVSFRTLVAWPEARAATPLLRFAETNAEPSAAAVALRDGCLRLADLDDVPSAERAEILRNTVRIARRPEERQRAVVLMGQVAAPELLDDLARLVKDPGLRAQATSATVQLAGMLGAVYPRQCLAALDEVRKLADTPELRKAVETGVKAVRNAGQSPEGYIVGWLISGPYTESGKDGSALFDVSFAPEKTGAAIQWRPCGAPANGVVDLAKSIGGGNDRVAYLRASVACEADQQASLELGSDDGIKAWLNGAIVHANNAVRPCSPGQDKVSVLLKKGENALLLKVTQGGGDWAVVARLRGADGKPLANVLVGGAQ